MTEGWVRVGAYVRCVDGGRVLLTRLEEAGNPHSGSWTMPGGGMELDEQPADTARREFREETGLDIELGALLGVRSFWFSAEESFRGAPGQAMGLVYAGTNPTGTLKTDFTDDDTTAAAAWFPITDVAELARVPLVDWAIGLIPGSD